MHSIVRFPLPSIFYHTEESVVTRVSGAGNIGLLSWIENAARRTSCDRDRRASARAEVCTYRLTTYALLQSDTRTSWMVVKIKVFGEE